MARWLVRVALVLLSVVGAGGVILGAATAETTARELLVTCLACGEQWLFMPSATLGAGLLSLLSRHPRLADRCPKCGSRAVVFGHPRSTGQPPHQSRPS